MCPVNDLLTDGENYCGLSGVQFTEKQSKGVKVMGMRVEGWVQRRAGLADNMVVESG